MTVADYITSSDEFERPRGKGDGNGGKREKRLERNRESARKCRRKRKAYVEDIEEHNQSLQEENAVLELENRRLNELIQQLQNGEGTDALAAPDAKRLKSEIWVTKAIDFSESAVHAYSPQQETFSRLAIVTTYLLLMTTVAAVDLVQCLTTPALIHHAIKTPYARPPQSCAKAARHSFLLGDQRESRQRLSLST